MSWLRGLVLFSLAVVAAAPVSAQSAVPADDGLPRLLQTLEQVLRAGQPDGYLQLISPGSDRNAALAFARDNMPGAVDRATVRERARSPLGSASSGNAFRLTVEILFESGNRGRLATWQLDVHRTPAGWLIDNQRQITTFENLYKLALDTTKQIAAHGLVVTAEDLQIRVADGAAFVADAGNGPTTVVLVGKGEMTFTPAPASERGQVAAFAGAETLRTSFDACYLRLNPAAFRVHVSNAGADTRLDPAELRRAEEIFAEDGPQSFTLDLGDLSPGPWSMLPAGDDLLAEIHTRRYGTLTYSHTAHEQEDIALFDRQHHHYIALYASKEKLASRGRFYSDDDLADYDVLHYDVDASFAPDRETIEGRTRMDLRVRAASLTSLEVRLADSLTVRSVVVTPFGRVMALRVRGQNAVVIRLPDTVTRDTRLSVTIAYGGQLAAQSDQPGTADAQGPRGIGAGVPVARSYLYSSQAAWYPQAPVQGFSTATLRVTIPATYQCAGSGKLAGVSDVAGAVPAAPPQRQFVFEAAAHVRYLTCLITRLVQVATQAIAMPAVPAQQPRNVLLTVEANPGEQAQARQVGIQAADIVRFYTSLIGDYPYSDLTIALVEHQLPGGHSPAYLAILDEQVAMSRLSWRDDPASFAAFPEFFAAHEIAHQWWGQAVGGKNYHEEWLSEAFAQYFAALYAEHAHGSAVFDTVLRQMERWTDRDSSAGPVYLGQRLGQLRSDGRVYRAVVYDKGALVLHMLRRLIGDDAFFGGLRLFYRTWKFRKAGSDDLRKAFETTSGKRLDTFFDRWIYGDALPRVSYSWQTTGHGDKGDAIDMRFEQAGDVFQFPVTVTIEYAGRPPEDVVVPIADRLVQRRLELAGRVRNVSVNRDGLVPGRISRR